MRQPSRLFFIAVTAVSLLLCAMAVAMWVRSYVASDFVEYTRPDWKGGVRTTLGRVLVWREHLHYRTWESKYGSTRPSADDKDLSLWRVYTFHNRSDVYWGGWEVAVPFGYIVGLTLMPLAIRVYLKLRRKPPPGLCARCGYDLRATPDRCPECGAVPTARAARHAGPGM